MPCVSWYNLLTLERTLTISACVQWFLPTIRLSQSVAKQCYRQLVSFVGSDGLCSLRLTTTRRPLLVTAGISTAAAIATTITTPPSLSRIYCWLTRAQQCRSGVPRDRRMPGIDRPGTARHRCRSVLLGAAAARAWTAVAWCRHESVNAQC